MRRIYVIVVMSALVLMTGCKKNKEDIVNPEPLPEPSTPFIATIKQIAPGKVEPEYFEDFLYEGDETRVREQRVYGPGIIIPTLSRYTKEGNQLQLRLYKNNVADTNYSVNYTLNTKGQAVEVYEAVAKRRTLYQYNTKDYISGLSYTENGQAIGRWVYYYSATNTLDSAQFFLPNNTLLFVDVYSYSATKKNTTASANKGLGFFGNEQVFAVQRMTKYVYQLPGAIGQRIRLFELDYDHRMDNQHRIAQTIITRVGYEYPSGKVTPTPEGNYLYTYK